MKMKLIKLKAGTQRGFEDGSVSEPDGFLAVFERDGHQVVKRFAVSSLARVSGANTEDAECSYQLLRAAKEADRDLAFVVYGENWREHIEFPPGSFFEGPPDGLSMDQVRAQLERGE